MRRPHHNRNGSVAESSVSSYTASPEAPVQKIFNCVVDENALLAAGRKSVRDGIRKWVATGAIRLFVPLHTIERLHGLKKANKTLNTDARDVIEWLDYETSKPNSKVTIQGGDETYTSWAEVEEFLLPGTLLSAENHRYDVKAHAGDGETSPTNGSFCDKGSTTSHASLADADPKTPSSPRSVYSATSPGILNSSPLKATNGEHTHSTNGEHTHSANTTPSHSMNNGPFYTPKYDGVTIPYSLRPLFSHILWLINQYEGPSAEVESLILLSNDHMKRSIAQRFGIRVKSSDQLRTAIKRETLDYKNRLNLFQKEKLSSTVADVANPEEAFSDDEDVVVYRRFANVTVGDASSKKVLDPNAFGGRTGSGATRGSRGGRSRGGGIGRGTQASRSQAPFKKFETGPIDPDSYARPPPASRNIRGGRRKLWEPT